MLPSIFISHGSPRLSIMDNESSTFLKNLSSLFIEPKYILVISAHWTTKDLKILSNENPKIIYDFFGFEDKLYQQKYHAKNDIKQVNKIIDLLTQNNIKIQKDKIREGYDHGVWSILGLLYPKANIPVIQLSLPLSYSIKQLLNLGKVLQEVRKDTLIIGSGAMTHDIQNSNYKENAPVEKEAEKFRNWVVSKIENQDFNTLENFMQTAPHLDKNHPTLEHILPLFISLGASQNKIGTFLNNIYMYGNQAMDTILFKE